MRLLILDRPYGLLAHAHARHRIDFPSWLNGLPATQQAMPPALLVLIVAFGHANSMAFADHSGDVAWAQ
jgi:hypothetical protein